MDNTPNEVKIALQPLKEITSVANELDKTEDGALVAITGGSFVLGLTMTGMFWLPFAITFSLLSYRFFVFLSKRTQQKITNKLNLIDIVVSIKERIWSSKLPESEKRQLSLEVSQAASDDEYEITKPNPMLLTEAQDDGVPFSITKRPVKTRTRI